MKRTQAKNFFFVFLIFGLVLLAGQARAAGYVTGTVRDAGTNNPISGIYVDAYEVNFGYVSTGCVNPSPLTNTTDANGQYGFCVWDGIYKVFFRRTDPVISYVGQWWNGASSFSAATPISVGGGNNIITIPNINASMSTSGGAMISGRVTGPGNVGIQSVVVSVFDYGQTAESKHGLAYGTTDSAGNYFIGGVLPSWFPPGTYKIKCDDHSSGNNNLPEWWNDKTNIATADPLVVTSGGTNQADCQLGPGGIISGTVTDSGHNPVNIAQVTIYDQSQKYITSTSTDGSGNYSAKRLPSGNYKVLFKGPSNSNLAYQWYNNQTAFSTGDWVPVTAGNTTPNINAELHAGGTITGTTGVSGAMVKVYDQFKAFVTYVTTATDGTFSLTGLPTGMYKVEFIKYNLASNWFDGHRTYDSADWVSVTAGNTTSGVNGSLLGALVVSGTVTDEQAVGIPRVKVSAYDVATSTPLSPTSVTDSLGNYTLNSLSPGNTRIYFDSFGTGYFPEWWDDKKAMAEANAINLVPGVAYPNIDARLDPSQAVYLPLILKN